jgi:hypothetical protein
MDATEQEQHAFLQFISNFNRNYASVDLLNEKGAIFLENYKIIEAYNSAPGMPFKMEVNKFADMTIEEIAPSS